MSTVQEAPVAFAGIVPDAADPELYVFTAEVFERMIAADVFADGDRVELWDGRITIKVAKNKPHWLSSNKTYFALTRILPPGWHPGSENPIRLDPKRVPLPNLVVLRGAFDDYIDRDPTVADVGLIVELADSSIRYDTTTKLAGYAEVGVPAYWVVNLIKNVIQTYAEPVPAERRYAQEATYAVGQAVPLRLDGVTVAEIPAVDLLPVRST